MADLTPKSTSTRTTGLSPKEQKLQSLREKMAQKTGTAGKVLSAGANTNVKTRNTFAGKKTAFQRKAT